MWCTALVGMATKYAEAVLAVKYREVDGKGNHVGGPMYYIKNGLGRHWVWLGSAFAVFGALALIFSYAFTPSAELGGFAGATVMLAIRFGVPRGIFSNEDGLGSAPIAHAAAETDNPVRQGSVAMLGTFIDTLIVCTITGLVIVTSGQWQIENLEYVECVGKGGIVAQDTSSSWGIEQTKNTCALTSEGEAAVFDKVQTGASLSAAAFSSELPGIGGYIVTLGLALFAFTTILGWSVYGERCVEYLFGIHAIVPFRVLWVLAIPLGAIISLDFMWLIADTLNALMAVPNLIALLLLSPVVFKVTRDYFRMEKP